MDVISKLISAWLVLTVINSANAQSTGNLEKRLRKLAEKLVERDTEIQRLKNMVETIYQSKALDKKFKMNYEDVTENVSLNLLSNESASGEFDELSDNEDIGSQVRQGLLQRALPESVAFYVYLSGSVCLNDHETVVFDREVTDVSGSFNLNDGIFDVPVSGTYVLSATVLAQYLRWITLEIVSNGKVLGAVLADSEDNDSHHSGSTTITVTLHIGDHVLLRRKTANGDCAIYSTSNGLTSFTGWLLY